MQDPDKDEKQHKTKKQRSARKTTELYQVKAGEAADSGQCKAYDSRESAYCRGLKEWFKRNTFNALLSLFTAIYAVTFAGGTYLTERAYLSFGRDDGIVIDFVKGDNGVLAFYRNMGRTPAREVVTQLWMTRENQIVPVDQWLSSVTHRMLPAGQPEQGFLIYGRRLPLISQKYARKRLV